MKPPSRHCSTPRRSATGLARDDAGATTLEWALLLGAIAIPSYYLFRYAQHMLEEIYRMMTTLNALPFP